jgi:hypothetical protein
MQQYQRRDPCRCSSFAAAMAADAASPFNDPPTCIPKPNNTAALQYFLFFD